jgi:hypothetical protein
MVSIGGGLETRRKIFRAFLIAAVVVAAGVGVFLYLQHPKNLTPEPAPPVQSKPTPTAVAPPKPVAPEPPPDPWHGLTAGTITLEKASEGNLVYAIGKLHNASDHERFGVKVVLDVFNASGDKLGTATDYTQSIDPGKEWRFKALITDRDAATAKLTAVKEE